MHSLLVFTLCIEIGKVLQLLVAYVSMASASQVYP